MLLLISLAKQASGRPAEVNTAITVTINATAPTHTVNPLFMGCHSDSGFGHQVRSFYSNLLSGESFEPEPGITWGHPVIPATANASLVREGRGAGMHGQTALRMTYRSGFGLVTLGNRGFDDEGLSLEAREYEGFLFVRSNTSGALVVGLQAYSNTPGEPAAALASKVLPFRAGRGTGWTRLNFTLTPKAAAGCVSVPPGSDPDIHCKSENSSAGHVSKRAVPIPLRHPVSSASQRFASDRRWLWQVCVRCGGEFVVGLASPADVLVDFVFLQPGAWGRYQGLSVHRGTVEMLLKMGVTAIRFGGSFVSYYGGYYFWKYWRGPAWLRPSVGAHWVQDVMSSWGPFEQIDLCNAAGIEPIIATTSQDQSPRHTGPYDCCTSEDMAELIEYCWGNASTVWGKQRIADGHPAPYRVRYLELGNEQYNTFFPDQVCPVVSLRPCFLFDRYRSCTY